ncbi:UDP-N-acetylglucosamine--LPS N-acetylglucosamine transferase, partial [Candidatus Kuenenbacteria bacterium CG23_combo_of_CG06-09_8_20_14_all_36_9]
MPLVGVLTDYAPHSYWIYDNVDFYVVPSDDTASKISLKGIDKSKIKPFGIPINPSFLNPVDKEGLYRRLGLKSDAPIVLIMGGGQGLGPIEEFVLLLNSLKANFQIVVTTGTNKRLYERLKRSEKKFHKTTVILGFCGFVNELMSISALLVTKPGGLTTAEALTKELPMLILTALPGQESMNAA